MQKELKDLNQKLEEYKNKLYEINLFIEQNKNDKSKEAEIVEKLKDEEFFKNQLAQVIEEIVNYSRKQIKTQKSYEEVIEETLEKLSRSTTKSEYQNYLDEYMEIVDRLSNEECEKIYSTIDNLANENNRIIFGLNGLINKAYDEINLNMEKMSQNIDSYEKRKIASENNYLKNGYIRERQEELYKIEKLNYILKRYGLSELSKDSRTKGNLEYAKDIIELDRLNSMIKNDESFIQLYSLDTTTKNYSSEQVRLNRLNTNISSKNKIEARTSKYNGVKITLPIAEALVKRDSIESKIKELDLNTDLKNYSEIEDTRKKLLNDLNECSEKIDEFYAEKKKRKEDIISTIKKIRLNSLRTLENLDLLEDDKKINNYSSLNVKEEYNNALISVKNNNDEIKKLIEELVSIGNVTKTELDAISSALNESLKAEATIEEKLNGSKNIKKEETKPESSKEVEKQETKEPEIKTEQEETKTSPAPTKEAQKKITQSNQDVPYSEILREKFDGYRMNGEMLDNIEKYGVSYPIKNERVVTVKEANDDLKKRVNIFRQLRNFKEQKNKATLYKFSQVIQNNNIDLNDVLEELGDEEKEHGRTR